MTYVIQHPARVDLFDTGIGQWGSILEAKQFLDESAAQASSDPGDVVLPLPEKQPIHPISLHP